MSVYVYAYVCVYVCVCALVRVCVRAYVRECVCACVRACVFVRACSRVFPTKYSIDGVSGLDGPKPSTPIVSVVDEWQQFVSSRARLCTVKAQ